MSAHDTRAGRRMLRANAKIIAARWLSGGLFGTLEAALATGARPCRACLTLGSPAGIHARSG